MNNIGNIGFNPCSDLNPGSSLSRSSDDSNSEKCKARIYQTIKNSLAQLSSPELKEFVQGLELKSSYCDMRRFVVNVEPFDEDCRRLANITGQPKLGAERVVDLLKDACSRWGSKLENSINSMKENHVVQIAEERKKVDTIMIRYAQQIIDKNREHKKRIEGLQKQLEEAQHGKAHELEKERLQERIDALRNAMNSMSKRYVDTTDSEREKFDECQRMKQEKVQLKKQIGELESKIDRMRESCMQQVSKSRSYESEIASIRASFAQADRELADERKKMEQEREQLQKRIDELENRSKAQDLAESRRVAQENALLGQKSNVFDNSIYHKLESHDCLKRELADERNRRQQLQKRINELENRAKNSVAHCAKKQMMSHLKQLHGDWQFHLGECYYHGRGLRKNYKEAIKYYRQSANQGSPSGQNALGSCYSRGHGVPKNHYEAFKYFELAADQGNDWGQNNLGVYYKNGYAGVKDYNKAFHYFKLSADQGNISGKNNLGGCYRDGCGAKRNYKEAVKLYRVTAALGNAEGQSNLGFCYQNGYGVERNYKNAFMYYALSAAQGNAIGQNNLGVCYQNGFGVERNYSEALKYFKLSAAQKNSFAQKNLKMLLARLPKKGQFRPVR